MSKSVKMSDAREVHPDMSLWRVEWLDRFRSEFTCHSRFRGYQGEAEAYARTLRRMGLQNVRLFCLSGPAIGTDGMREFTF